LFGRYYNYKKSKEIERFLKQSFNAIKFEKFGYNLMLKKTERERERERNRM